MSALENWFSLTVRRGRKSFFLGNLALLLTIAVCYFVWTYFAESEQSKSIGLLVFGAPAVAASYLLSAQRLRDFGVSGWFAVAWIPINSFDDSIKTALNLAALIVLCGIPGTPGPNKYGDVPSN